MSYFLFNREYSRLRTNRRIHCIKFSPDSKHFALTKEDKVFVYRSPGPHTNDYSPFVMEKILKVSVFFTWVDMMQFIMCFIFYRKVTSR